MGREILCSEIAEVLPSPTTVAVDFNNFFPAFPKLDCLKLIGWLSHIPQLDSLFAFAGETKRRIRDIKKMKSIESVRTNFHYECHSKVPVRKTINGHDVWRADLDTSLVARITERVVRGCYDSTRKKIGNVILLAGDGDYAPLLDTVRANGVERIIVAAPANSFSGDLARKADFSLHLDERFIEFIRQQNSFPISQLMNKRTGKGTGRRLKRDI